MERRRLLLISNVTVLALVLTAVAIVGLRPAVAIVVLLGIAAFGLNAAAMRSPAATGRLAAPIRPAEQTAVSLTALAAALPDAPDLIAVLRGIVADERGEVVAGEDRILLALFRGRAHQAAAVHAAQRMVSNVDAVRRRLEREVRISIGVDQDVDAAIALEKLTRDKRVPVLVSAATVAQLGSNAAVASIDHSDSYFSFAPVQQSLF